MKKKISTVLLMVLLLQIFSFFSIEKVEATAPTKPMTHTIIDTAWRSSQMQGPSYYDYDDGLWHGRLYRVNTTWATRRSTTINSRVAYRDREFDEDKPSEVWSFNYMKNLYETEGYKNVEVLSMEWTGANQGPSSYTYSVREPDGTYKEYGPYKYRRYFRAEFEYDSFRYTSTYSGTLTYRTIPPVIKINVPAGNFKYHNQDVILVEGFIKDEDIGDKNTIHYTIEGSSHTNKNVALTNPIEITATGNDTFFKGAIQLDQTINPGQYTLKIWGRDDKGADSNIVEIPITINNVLEDILNNLRTYTIQKDNFQMMVFSSSSQISKSSINDSFISKIKTELDTKNIKLYFIGNEESKSYIDQELLLN